MKRGTVGLLGTSIADISADVQIRLHLRADVPEGLSAVPQEARFPATETLTASYRRYCGDLLELGKGELLTKGVSASRLRISPCARRPSDAPVNGLSATGRDRSAAPACVLSFEARLVIGVVHRDPFLGSRQLDEIGMVVHQRFDHSEILFDIGPGVQMSADAQQRGGPD